MSDMLGNLARRTLFAIQKHVRLAIERLANRKQLFDSFEAIGTLQKRTVRLVADARQNRLWRRPKADHQSMSLQTFHVRWIHNQTATCRNHAPPQLLHLANDLAFMFAKTSLTIGGKDFGNAFAGALFDQHVGIDEAQM